MKKNLFSLFTATIFYFTSNAQTFWTEDFGTGCNQNLAVTSYTGVNGAWTMLNSGPATQCGGNTTPNEWFVSAMEAGAGAGNCEKSCSPFIINRTLHVGNIPSSPNASIFCPAGDCGAAYDAGGNCALLSTPPSTQTDKRAESPVINCTGKSTITLAFNYIENGDGINDDATLWYFDGANWSQLSNPAKTIVCGGSQSTWTAYSIALPTTANNNPNVKIGFRWVNDDDGNGTDPSFAVDDITLSVAPNAVSQTDFASQIIIYPNPSTGIFQVQVGNGQLAIGNEYKIEIYNVMGEKVTQSVIPSGARNLTIDLSNQPSGIYFIQVKTTGGIVNKKIIINH
ncbi:MAG: T9SS type A sorting domain-containing protein [Bacteroidetes bacterium]|nr:T9SS type A sorting domain-containing protein [Bacteroidota bacterium]